MYRICLPLKAPKGAIFADLSNRPQFCFYLPVTRPRRPGRDPGPLDHLESLATIVQLTDSLPERLPMREELRSAATRALDAAVADLGSDVKLHRLDANAESALA